MNKFLQILLSFYLMTLPLVAQETFHTNPLCWTDPRWYEPSGKEQEYLIKMFDYITSVSQSEVPLPEGLVYNAEHSYAYHIASKILPDKWSGATEVTVRLFVERSYYLKILFSPVFNVQDIKWISNRWLFARVVLGRYSKGEIIFNVESEKFISSNLVSTVISFFNKFVPVAKMPHRRMRTVKLIASSLSTNSTIKVTKWKSAI